MQTGIPIFPTKSVRDSLCANHPFLNFYPIHFMFIPYITESYVFISKLCMEVFFKEGLESVILTFEFPESKTAVGIPITFTYNCM